MDDGWTMKRHVAAALAGGVGAALAGLVSCSARADDGLLARQTEFAALLSRCAPDAPADYMRRIVAHESGFRPYALHDNTSGASFFPGTYQDAVNLAGRILRAGHSLDVGLGQINVSNWEWLGLTVKTALDPCQNVRAEARVLSAMSRYNTGDPRRGLVNGYVQKVLAAEPPSGVSQQPDQKLPDDKGGVSEQGELPPDADRITTTYEGDK